MEKVIEDIKIRLMVPQDRDAVNKFFSELGEEGGTFFNRNGGNQRGMNEFIDGTRPNRTYWVAIAETEEGEEVAGLTFIWKTNTKTPWFGIGITEKWKGRHLGRRLIATVREHCEANGCGGILLTTAPENIRGQKLYEHCGFERIGTYHDGEFLYLLSFDNENIE